jgi:hypothetical protein
MLAELTRRCKRGDQAVARYFCRVCHNNSNWVHPTGNAGEGLQTHHGNLGFAWEEWNFDFEFLIDGWKYGWIEGFWTEPDPSTGMLQAKTGRPLVPFGDHDVILYRKHGQAKEFIGRIRQCEHIPQVPPALAYPSSRIDDMARQAIAARADIRRAGHRWDAHPTLPGSTWSVYEFQPIPNIRFMPADYEQWEPRGRPLKYNRYGPLKVDGNADRERLWHELVTCQQ